MPNRKTGNKKARTGRVRRRLTTTKAVPSRSREIKRLFQQRFDAVQAKSTEDLVRTDQRLRALGVTSPETHSNWNQLVGSFHSKTYVVPHKRSYSFTDARDRRREPVKSVKNETRSYLFLSTDDAVTVVNTLAAFQRCAKTLGLRELEIVDVHRGSIRVKFLGWFKNDKTKKEATRVGEEFLATAESWAKAEAKKPQADVDATNADSISAMLSAVGEASGAFVFDGFVILKWNGTDGPQIVTKTLTARESRLVENHPGILGNPRTFMSDLATLMRSDDLNNVSSSSAPPALGPGQSSTTTP